MPLCNKASSTARAQAFLPSFRGSDFRPLTDNNVTVPLGLDIPLPDLLTTAIFQIFLYTTVPAPGRTVTTTEYHTRWTNPRPISPTRTEACSPPACLPPRPSPSPPPPTHASRRSMRYRQYRSSVGQCPSETQPPPSTLTLRSITTPPTLALTTTTPTTRTPLCPCTQLLSRPRPASSTHPNLNPASPSSRFPATSPLLLR